MLARIKKFAFLKMKGFALYHSDISDIHFWDNHKCVSNAYKYWISYKFIQMMDKSVFVDLFGFGNFLGRIWDAIGKHSS